MPTQVQLALVTALGQGSRSSARARDELVDQVRDASRRGPPPWMNDRCSASWIDRVNGRIGSGSRWA